MINRERDRDSETLRERERETERQGQRQIKRERELERKTGQFQIVIETRPELHSDLKHNYRSSRTFRSSLL
jgi:hypothetical protein